MDATAPGAAAGRSWRERTAGHAAATGRAADHAGGTSPPARHATGDSPDPGHAAGSLPASNHAAGTVTLDDVAKIYPGGQVAVDGLSLEVPAGELVVFVGPPGCGKSTVLRMINRLVSPTAGRVSLNGEDVAATDPVWLRRRIGYLTRTVGLFPHQTVRVNVATVPRLLGWPRRRVRARTDEALELVGLDPVEFGDRYPHELSEPQRLRVGVARALSSGPVVLLMDEPFSAVDPVERSRLRDEFARLRAALPTTVLLATRDLDEAVRLGDRIAVLSEAGRLEQYAPPAQLLARPGTATVRDFLGADRGIRRLAVTPVAAALRPLTAAVDVAGLPSVPVGGTLYDALAAMLTEDALNVVVFDGDRPVGTVSRSALFGTQ